MKTKAILLLLLLLVLFSVLADAGTAGEGMAVSPLSPDISPLLRTLPILPENFIAGTTATASAQANDPGWIPSTSLFFIMNNGQNSDDVLFEVISDGGPIFYTSEGSVFRLIGYNGDDMVISTVESRFIGETCNSIVEGIDPLSCKVNFIMGANSSDRGKYIQGYQVLQPLPRY
jgi:hypothetical protein